MNKKDLPLLISLSSIIMLMVAVAVVSFYTQRQRQDTRSQAEFTQTEFELQEIVNGQSQDVGTTPIPLGEWRTIAVNLNLSRDTANDSISGMSFRISIPKLDGTIDVSNYTINQNLINNEEWRESDFSDIDNTDPDFWHIDFAGVTLQNNGYYSPSTNVLTFQIRANQYPSNPVTASFDQNNTQVIELTTNTDIIDSTGMNDGTFVFESACSPSQPTVSQIQPADGNSFPTGTSQVPLSLHIDSYGTCNDTRSVEFQVGSSPDNLITECSLTGASATSDPSCTVATQDGQTYYWNVLVSNEGSQTYTFSSPRSFTVTEPDCTPTSPSFTLSPSGEVPATNSVDLTVNVSDYGENCDTGSPSVGIAIDGTVIHTDSSGATTVTTPFDTTPGTSYELAAMVDNGARSNTQTTTFSVAEDTSPQTRVEYRLQAITDQRSNPMDTAVTFDYQNGQTETVNLSAINSYDYVPNAQGEDVQVYSFYYTDPHTTSDVIDSVLIKARGHLAKRFNNFVVNTQNEQYPNEQIINTTLEPQSDGTNNMRELDVGDVNGDNRITLDDITQILVILYGGDTQYAVPVPANTPEDLNDDQRITIDDVAFAMMNYNDFVVNGDN